MKRLSKAHPIQTRVIECQNALSAEALGVCVRVLKDGGVIAFPTDTVYGIGASAFNTVAVGRVFSLKGRSYRKPLPVFLKDAHQLSLAGRDIPWETRFLIRRFWPGPLTLVVRTARTAMLASRGRDTIALRVPDHGVVKKILDEFCVPLAVTSANVSGKKSLTTGAQVRKEFMGKVDVIIDGGKCSIGRESSVVDATHYPFTVLREGAISKEELLECLHTPDR